MNRKERIEKVLAEFPEASADEVARTLVDQDVSAGEYEGCSSELEGWYGEYENAASEIIASRPRREGLDIYVPAPESLYCRTIRKGSGIVGTTQPDGSVIIDYEGNLYGAENLQSFEQRVIQAHGRHVWNGRGYPTTARALVLQKDLVLVATVSFDAPDPVLTVLDRAALDEWIEEGHLASDH